MKLQTKLPYSTEKERKKKIKPFHSIFIFNYAYLCSTCNFTFQINIDSSTRETIIKNIQEPTQTCFEEAQKIVHMHMERDSYPRFLKSEMYQKLLKTIQPNNNFWPPLKSLNWRWYTESPGFVLLI